MTNVYQAALDEWGKDLQVIMAIEEMAELTQALTKDLRGIPDSDNILEEMADVEIMLTQLKIVYGDTKDIKEKKLLRLAKMLNKNNQ